MNQEKSIIIVSTVLTAVDLCYIKKGIDSLLTYHQVENQTLCMYDNSYRETGLQEVDVYLETLQSLSEKINE